MASLVTAPPGSFIYSDRQTVNNSENAKDLKKNLIYGLLLKDKSLTGTFQEAIGDVIKSLEKISEPVLKGLDEFVKCKDYNNGSSRALLSIYEAMQVWSAINEKFLLLVISESACQQVCYDLTQIYIYCWKLMETVSKDQAGERDEVPVTDLLNLFTKPANVTNSTGKKFKIRRECCICQEKNAEEFTKLPCGHQYHTTCLKQWGMAKSCPLCRSEVSENFRARHVTALNSKWNLGLNFLEISNKFLEFTGLIESYQFADRHGEILETDAEAEAAWRAVWGTEYNNYERNELLYYNSVVFLMGQLYIDEYNYDWKTRTVDFNDGTAQFSLNVVELQELEQWNMLLWDALLEDGSVEENCFLWDESILDAIKYETRIQEVQAVHRFIFDGHLDSEEGDIIDIDYDAEERKLSLYLQLPATGGMSGNAPSTNFTEHNYFWEDLICHYNFNDYLEGWHEGIPGRVNELRSFDLLGQVS
jgi:hypothetical protein